MKNFFIFFLIYILTGPYKKDDSNINISWNVRTKKKKIELVNSNLEFRKSVALEDKNIKCNVVLGKSMWAREERRTCKRDRHTKNKKRETLLSIIWIWWCGSHHSWLYSPFSNFMSVSHLFSLIKTSNSHQV